MASWLCPKNRSRTGMVPEGPGGISMWATSTDGDPHGVGVAWWWLLLVLAILLSADWISSLHLMQLINDFGRFNAELQQRNVELERLLGESEAKLSMVNNEDRKSVV